MAMLVKVHEKQETILKEIKTKILGLTQKDESHSTAINLLKHPFGQMLVTLNQRQPGTISINIVQNLRNSGYVFAITTGSGITTIEPPLPVSEAINNETSSIEYEKVKGHKGIVAKDKSNGPFIDPESKRFIDHPHIFNSN